jgi:hypothetical protein
MTGCRSLKVHHMWQNNQLTGFGGKIKKEIAANEGSTILVACIARKKSARKSTL